MCLLRNLECGDSRELKIASLKKVLSNSDDIVETKKTDNIKDPVEDTISFDIINASSMKRIGDQDGLIILDGNVDLVFKSIEEGERKLQAQTIIIDTSNSKLAALGGVKYSNKDDAENSLLQDISGDIITLDWASNSIQVTHGTISTERKNSEGDSVVFYASSSLLSLNSHNNSLILKDGFITTNPDTAYSSISAKKIALLNHGDMYLERAKLSIGRIDVLYLPVFFSPGATMIGNPSIGYESTRGSFVNTTFEILGKYPNFATSSTNSFNSLLKSGNADSFANGPIYNSNETFSPLNQWAIDSKSYLTLFLDSYEKTPYSIESSDKGSIVLGYESQLNIIDSKLKINSSAITSFASDGIVGNLDFYSYYPIFRYAVNLDATLKLKNGSIDISLPFVSDPSVKKTYSNRLSTFNIDSLWGSNQTFPTTYRSDITSFSWVFDGKFNLSPTFLGMFVKNIKINHLNANIDYKWEKTDGSYSYNVKQMTLPKLELQVSGDLLNLSASKEEKAPDKDIDKRINKETNEEADKLSEILNSLYKSDIKTSSTTKDVSSLNLSYIFNNNFYYTDNEDITKSDELYNKSLLTFSTKGQIEPKIITYSGINKFTYIHKNDLTGILINSFDIVTQNIVSLPFINLSYYFNSKLYKYSQTLDNGIESIENPKFAFNDEFITSHAIEWKDTYDLNNIKVTPALKFVLPPLNLAFKPSLLIKYNTFENSTTFNFDVDSSKFELTDIDNKIKYSLYNFNFNFDISYDIKMSKTSIRALDPLYLKSSVFYYNKDKNQYLSYSSKFFGLYNDSENYFSEFLFTYKNSFIMSKLNFNTQDTQLQLDYFKNTVSLSDYTKYWWKNRIGLKLNIDATFNYSFRDKYATYFSLSGDLSFKIAEFMAIKLSIKTSNYGFYRYYDDSDNFEFDKMFTDLLKSFDIFGSGRSSTQFNLEQVSLDFIHMMEDWDLHCKYSGSVVLSNYNYQWVPTLSIFLQWKTLPELKVDQSFTNDGTGWGL